MPPNGRERPTDDDLARRAAYLAAVHHEVNTPLSVLLGWVEALPVSGHDEGLRRRAFESMGRAARELADLLDAVLSEARADVTARQQPRGECDLAPLVADLPTWPQLDRVRVDPPGPLRVAAPADVAEPLVVHAARGVVGLTRGEVALTASRGPQSVALSLTAADAAGAHDPLEPLPAGRASPAAIRLAAARALAGAVGGGLSAARTGDRLVVELRLPLPADGSPPSAPPATS